MKLQLSSRTLRVLNATEIAAVAGGDRVTGVCPVGPTLATSPQQTCCTITLGCPTKGGDATLVTK